MAASKRTRAKNIAYKLDEQARYVCHLLRTFSESLDNMGEHTYSQFSAGGFYDALIERFAGILTADADGKEAEGFLPALRRMVPASPPLAVESLLPA
jgi:hypothetical protein